MILCYVCRQPTPDLFKASHHVKPQAAGGKKEDEIPLCGGCHDNVHRIAQMIMANNNNKAIAAINITYGKDKDAQHRIMELAKQVVYWMQRKKDGMLIRPGDKVKLDIKCYLTLRERQALKQIARDNNMSQIKFIEHVLKREIYRKFPTLRP